MKHRLLQSENAVSSVVGVIIIIGLTITSIGIILLYSVPAIGGLENSAKIHKSEQSFSVLDSRMSKVALGESPSQLIAISLMGGTLNINGNEDSYNNSQIVVVTANSSGYENITQNGYYWKGWEKYGLDNFSSSMGSIECLYQDHTVAYEGGGVWSKYPNGRSVMISPPEFHYNGQTLTLPIMKVNGYSSVSGSSDISISVTSSDTPKQLFPDRANNRTNPLEADKIIIFIKSEFYDAWADYANSQTYTRATTDIPNKTAIVELDVIPPMGKNVLAYPFKVGAIDDTQDYPMHNFSFELHAKGSQGLNSLNNYEVFASSGSRTLTFKLHEKSNEIKITSILYQDTSVDGDNEEEWEGKDGFPVIDKQSDEMALIDLLDDSFDMEYTKESAFTWNQTNSIQSLYNVTQHYMKLITEDGAVQFKMKTSGNSDPIDYGSSSIELNYDSRPESLIYLHVTENEVSAEIV
ncbi:hypothetical protein Mzhil_1469 [Methanosalsum zhilinae DSM 4017]|uniref:Archaeal Type IV pilin N-terminal domain-containing protein n=1 Tax=Methanosalsum zhilinae (strain DSM 4017 / NBRC 107636 / OCM 62 / WeN5) TaxID=679901 RepID=F7XNV1_METZD|nr:hypothetical protein [Methanosalsum zhilinae]AEH61308.1 hypothetical protein Mzhil_1469 [Methanosalsum zhilinae DSM 4017]